MLPGILSGRHPRYTSLRRLFWAVFMKEMFRRIRDSFHARSRHGKDDLGNSWDRLHKRTIRQKRKAHSHFGETVPPAKHPTWINRDTEALFKSLAMGIISGNEYVPREDQIAKLSGDTVTLGTKVEYAPYVNDRRVLIPDNIRPWVRESLAIAFDRIAPRLGELGK